MSGQGAEPVGARTSRRHLLGWGAAGGLALASAASCSRIAPIAPDLPDPRPPRPTCVPRSALPRYGRLAGRPLVYEIDRRRGEFAIDAGFAGQLGTWLDDLVELTGWQIEQLWTYGAWTAGGSACSSWHDAGRAFDLSRLRLRDGSDISCRYDQWRSAPASRLTEARRAYWALAASAHKHFAYVLTHLYNAAHHNHIHLDNGRSGPDRSSFSARSPSQVQAVQGICAHLWDTPVDVTGRYDAETADAVRAVLADLDLGDELADQAAWSAFLDASTRRGAAPA